MSNRSLPTIVELGNIRDVERFCRRILERLPNGMFLRPDEYEDELFDMLGQLIDWYRPVDPLYCLNCHRKRGQQHTRECKALPPQRIRRMECLGCGVERYAEGPATEDGDRPLALHDRRVCPDYGMVKFWGCFTCGNERGKPHAEDCPHALELQQRYDADRTDDFALFAQYKLSKFYVNDLCRRILGRTGSRIPARSFSELDERADAGHRPWEAFTPEQGDLRFDLDGDRERAQAERASKLARSRAVLGLRPTR